VKVSYPYAQKIHYMTFQGRYITPNANQGRAQGAVTGPLGETTITDPVITPNQTELVLNLTVQSVAGTYPTLDAYLDILDPVEPQNQNYNSTQNPPLLSVKLNSKQITSSGATLRVVITNGVATSWESNQATVLGNLNVPVRWQVRLAIEGMTLPSFGIIATFEAR
jgi:hypothetical protein